MAFLLSHLIDSRFSILLARVFVASYKYYSWIEGRVSNRRSRSARRVFPLISEAYLLELLPFLLTCFPDRCRLLRHRLLHDVFRLTLHRYPSLLSWNRATEFVLFRHGTILLIYLPLNTSFHVPSRYRLI